MVRVKDSFVEYTKNFKSRVRENLYRRFIDDAGNYMVTFVYSDVVLHSRKYHPILRIQEFQRENIWIRGVLICLVNIRSSFDVKFIVDKKKIIAISTQRGNGGSY